MDAILTTWTLIRIVVSAILLTAFLTAHSYANECEMSGEEFDFAENTEVLDAYDRLRSCEKDQAASSDVLFFIALMIGYAELDGDYPGRDRHVYNLIYRAAELGNEDALLALADFHLDGSETLGIEENQAINDCIQELAGRAPEEDTDFSEPVMSCLSLSENGSSE